MADANASTEAQPQAQAPAPAPAPNSAAPARPDWAPEKYWDATAGQVKVEELARAHVELGQRFAQGAEGLRRTLEPEIRTAIEAERHAARPADVGGYDAAKVVYPRGVNVLAEEPKDRGALKAGEKYALIREDDAFVSWWKQTAFDAGLSQDAFAAGVARYAESVAVQVPTPQQLQEHRAGILAALGENGQRRLSTLYNTLKGWLGDEVSALDEVVQSPAAIMALERLVERAGGPKFAGGETGSPAGKGGALTLQDLRKMQADPRYRTDSRFRDEVAEGYRRLYPGR